MVTLVSVMAAILCRVCRMCWGPWLVVRTPTYSCRGCTSVQWGLCFLNIIWKNKYLCVSHDIRNYPPPHPQIFLWNSRKHWNINCLKNMFHFRGLSFFHCQGWWPFIMHIIISIIIMISKEVPLNLRPVFAWRRLISNAYILLLYSGSTCFSCDVRRVTRSVERICHTVTQLYKNSMQLTNCEVKWILSHAREVGSPAKPPPKPTDRCPFSP